MPGWEATLSFTRFTAKDAQNLDVNTDQPRKLLRLFTTYQFLDLLPELTVGGGVNWEGENYTLAVNPFDATERLEQGAYALVNLMARYDLSENLSAQLNVDNLLDKAYYAQIGFYSQLAYGEPRNYNLSFRYKF